jgi:putative sigma-54 modulation protein
MRTKYAGRQVSISKKLKAISEAGMERISRVLGDNCSASIVLKEERSRQIAEVTIACRYHTIVGQADGPDQEQALQSALEKAEKQALKLRTRERSRKRQPSKDKLTEAAPRPRKAKPLLPPEDAVQSANGNGAGRTLPVVLHSFPSAQPIAEPHIVRSQEAVSMTPMTIEEAVKEAEFRDREVFVFRNLQGVVHVLYRKRDGRMALIEAP